MWPVSQNFLTAITGPHAVTNRVELWYGGTKVVPSMKVVSGSISGSRSMVRRTLSLTVTADTKAERRDLWEQVSLPGAEVRAFRGVRFLDGTVEEVPLGVFLTRQPSIDERSGVIEFGSCPDRMQRVIDYTFETPRTSSAGMTYPQQVQQLLGEAVTGLQFTANVGTSAGAVPSAVWESDRAGAVRQLSTSVAAETWFGPSGAAVMGRVKTLSDQADWKLYPGSGALVEASSQIDWDAAYNVVVARGDRLDGGPAVFGVARDTNPASPTYWRGPMGPKPRQYASPLLTSNAMCVLAAQSLLAKSTGARKSIDLTAVANPALDVGDRIDAILPQSGWSERHIVDTFSIDLTSAAMTVTSRATGTIGEADVDA